MLKRPTETETSRRSQYCMFYLYRNWASSGLISVFVFKVNHSYTNVDCCLCFLYNRWMEACLNEELPSPTELEEALRNGVLLAKLGNCFAPKVVPLKKIYDLDQARYKVCEKAEKVQMHLCIYFRSLRNDYSIQIAGSAVGISSMSNM